MELYILSSDYKRQSVIDVYESLIWTERFNGVGEFELIVDFNFLAKELTIEGTYLGLSESQRIMVIETTERITGDDGTQKVKITGPSLESILKHRLNHVFTASGSTAPPEKVEFALPFETTIYNRVMDVIRTNATWTQDNLPGLQTGRLNDEGSLPYPELPVGSKFIVEVGTLAETVEMFGNLYGIGYAIVKDGDTGNLYFEFYTGTDRTSGQGVRPAIIFSKTMDNLGSTNELRTINNLKTVALVMAKNAHLLVYANNEDESSAGLDRRVMVVKASDLTDSPGTALTEAMTIRGQTELAKLTRTHALDGEINIGDYKYNEDYFLGDLVEQRSPSGVSGIFRVVEQVFVSDAEGQRAYPTLKLDLLVTLGAWYSWGFTSYWDESGSYYWDTV